MHYITWPVIVIALWTINVVRGVGSGSVQMYLTAHYLVGISQSFVLIQLDIKTPTITWRLILTYVIKTKVSSIIYDTESFDIIMTHNQMFVFIVLERYITP